MKPKRSGGLTLTEMLVALLILGEIATFTIPKLLQAQRNQRFNAAAMEVAGMIANAYDRYKMANPVTGAINASILTPYMNYVRVDNSGSVDMYQGLGSRSCSGGFRCLVMHNGGKLLYNIGESFCGTGPNHAIYFYFDPDGVNSGTTNGPGKSVLFFLYANGRITSGKQMAAATQAGNASKCLYSYNGFADPGWFRWN